MLRNIIYCHRNGYVCWKHWSKIFYCLVLAVSLVIVSQLLVTGISAEGIENCIYETAPKGYFTTCMVGHKVNVVVLGSTENSVGIYDRLDLGVHRNVLSLKLLFRALQGFIQMTQTGMTLPVFSNMHFPDVYWLTDCFFCASSSY